jgi:HrpA-like RNA helicase
MLSVENVFYTPRNEQKTVEKRRKKFTHLQSDHLTLLNAYKAFEQALQDPKESSRRFCKENYLNEKSLRKAKMIKNQIEYYIKGILSKREKVEDMEVDEEAFEDGDERNSLVIQCLYRGMPNNIAEHFTNNLYKTKYGREECSIHPSSSLLSTVNRTPGSRDQEAIHKEKLVYSELIQTSKNYLRYVTDVSGI